MKKLIKVCATCVTCLGVFSPEISGMFLKKDGAYNESNQIPFRNDILDEIEIQTRTRDDSCSILNIDKIVPSGCHEVREGVLDDYRDKAFYAVIIPSRITAIDDRAFEEFSFEILIMRSVQVIGYSAFANCGNLREINMPNSVTTISSSAFDECGLLEHITIPNKVKDIADNAFYNCISLKKVEILSSKIRICEGAFEECTALKTLLINSSIVKIDKNAFKNCENLNYISIRSDEWILINKNAFPGCDSLADVTVGNETYAKEKFLTRYNQPEDLTIPAKIKALDDFLANDNCLRTVNFENGSKITNIGEMAFYDCEELSRITIPTTVNHISTMAFEGCGNLKQIWIPDNVSVIGHEAFFGSGLESIIIHPNMKIGANAFKFCKNLVIAEIPTLNVKVGGNFEDIFGSCSPNLRIYVQRTKL